MARKSNLRPRMKVRNVVSGSIGEVRGKNGKLLLSNRRYVQVRVRNKSGKHKGRWEYATWLVANLEHVE